MANPKIRMKLRLSNQKFYSLFDCRNISENDIESLSHLMFESYKNTIDYNGETLQDANSEVRGTLNGKYGRFLKNCSFVYEKEDEIYSASMVTFYEKLEMPLLTFLMTHPNFKKCGIAKFLLQKSINSLVENDFQELSLFVTEENTPALSLYHNLGFQKF